MKYYGICPASCGEFVQGILGDREYLVSYATNLYSKVVLTNDNKFVSGPSKSRCAIEEVFKYFDIDKKESEKLSLYIESDIPIGKGMASSSADIGATIKATLMYLNKELSSYQISEIATNIEPTDSIFIKENTIFDPLTANVYKTLGNIEGMKVLVLEPNERLDTIKLRHTNGYFDLKNKNKRELENVYDMVKCSFENQDLKMLGSACTLSGILNENIHKKEGLDEIIKISKQYGAYGINVAHSGTVVAVLLDNEMNEQRLIEMLSIKNLHKKYKKMYPLEIIKGGIKGGVLSERINSTCAWK